MTIESISSLFTPLGSIQSKKTASSAAAAASGSADFSTVLADLVKQTASTIKASEDTAIKGIQGQAPLQDVVRSVMDAQTKLQAAMALRDKAVSAYQDLTRMTI